MDGYEIHEILQENILVLEGPSEAIWPSAKSIGHAGRVMLEEGEFLSEGCSPRYVQPSYAERPKESAHPSESHPNENQAMNDDFEKWPQPTGENV